MAWDGKGKSGRGAKQMLQAGAWPAQAWAKETCGDYFEVIDTRRAQGRAGESFSDHTARPFRVVLKKREPGAKTPRRQTEEAGGGFGQGSIIGFVGEEGQI
jgi:hypothetical protein